MRFAGLALLLSLLCAGVAWPAAEYLRPEWSVGQEQVAPELLAVTPPLAAPAELTIQEAVSAALQRDVGFRGTVQALLSARSNLQVALQRWELELFGRLQRTGDDTTVKEAQAGSSFLYSATTGADLTLRAELDRLDSEEKAQTLTASLRQPLLAGRGPASAGYEEVRAARNAYRAALLSYFVERQDLIVSVIGQYFNVVEEQKVVEIQGSSVRLAEEAVRDAQLRLEAGMVAEIDLTRAQLRLSRAQTDEVLARQRAADAMDRLLLLLGYQVGGNSSLVTTVSYQPTAVDLEAAVKQALEQRPEIWLADLGIEDREAALRIRRSRSLPSLDLFGSVRRTSNGLEERSWSLGLETTVPIASRSLREAVRQAQWALLVTQQRREEVRQRVASEVRSQVRAAQAAQANVDIATKGLSVAERSRQIAGRMFEEGLAENRDLLDAQDELTRSRTSLVTSQINYYLATVRLRRATGVDVATDLPTERAQPAAGESAGGETPIAPAAPPAAPSPQAGGQGGAGR